MEQQTSDPNFQDDSGMTSLMWECIRGIDQLASLILEKNGNLNLQDKNKKTALMHAITCNHTKIASNIIDIEGCDLNIQDEDGWTALMYACWGSKKEIALKLLKKGARIDLETRLGKTALMFAVMQCNKDIIEKILDIAKNTSYDFNHQETQNEWNVLMYLIASCKDTCLLDSLLEIKLDVSLRNAEGNTALMIAADISEELASKMIDYCIKFDIYDFLDKTFIDVLKEKRLIFVLKRLKDMYESRISLAINNKTHPLYRGEPRTIDIIMNYILGELFEKPKRFCNEVDD